MSVVITYNQLAKLASPLKPAGKRRLAQKLEQNASQKATKAAAQPPAESQLTPAQRKTWKNNKQGFERLKQIRAGQMQAPSSDDYLNKLQAEGYL